MRTSCITAALLALLLTAGQGYSASSGYNLFQKGLVQERAHGNLNEAIRLYTQIIEEYGDDHALAAKALLQIGACYEKLGRGEAQKAYQRIIDEYSDRKQEVAVARENLARLAAAPKQAARRPTFRKIEIASRPQNGVLSPDGNRLAFMSDGAVWAVPLHGKVDPNIAGEPVRLAEVRGIWDTSGMLAWSANGEWIAVYGKDGVYVIPAAGGEPRVVQLPEQGGHLWSYRLSLSPNGEMLAFSALELGKDRNKVSESRERYVYTIPTAGGQPQRISSGWARMPSFSSDGEYIAYVGYRKGKDWPQNTEGSRHHGDLWVAPSDGGAPVKLADVNGQLRGPIWSPDGRFIAALHEPGATNDSKEMWVYSLSPDKSSAGEPVKISLPRSSWDMPAGWTPRGELGVFMATQEHWATYAVPASGGKAVQITPESIIPYYPRWSPDGARIYLRGVYPKERKVTALYVPAAGGDPVEVPVQSQRRLVVRVPGGGFNISPDGKEIVFSAFQEPFTPQDGVDVWTIPVEGGLAARLTNDTSRESYPCWSPDGKWVAFVAWHAKSENEGFDAIHVVPAAGGETRQVSSETDKVGGGAIAFAPDGKRIAFFSGGAIKTIPVEGGQAEVLVSAVQSNGHSQLAYSPDGSKIAHSAAGKIWITPLDGGKPEALQTGLPMDAKLSDFGWSPDGEKIAFVGTIGGKSEFWLIGNFLPKSEEKSMVIRQVWSGPGVDTSGGPSPDGRHLSFTDWKTGDLALRELPSGKTRWLTEGKKGGKEKFRFASNSVISPDGKLIAYSWTNEHGTYDLCMIGTDGSGDRTLYSNRDHEVYPISWSPDATRILAMKHKTQGAREGDTEIVSVSVQDGSLTTIGIPWVQNRVCYSPRGRFMAYDYPVAAGSSNWDIALLDPRQNSRTTLLQHPGSDRLLGWVPHRQEILFLSDRAGSLDMWAIKVVDGRRQDSPTIVAQGIGQIQPQGFTDEGAFFFSRNASTLTTSIVPFDARTGEISLDAGKALLGSKDSAKWSPDGRHLACAVEQNHQWHLRIWTLTTGEEQELAPHLDVRRPDWSADGRFILVTGFDYDRRTQEDYHGGIYKIDAQDGDVTELVALPPVEEWRRDNWTSATAIWTTDGRAIFYKSHGKIVRRDIESGREELLYRNDHFEKALALSPDGEALAFGVRTPDDPNGRILTMPASGGEPRELCRSSTRAITWTPDSEYVLYAEPQGKSTTIWRASASGGERQMVAQSPHIVVSLDVHPNRKEIALSTFDQGSSIWVMEDFLPGMTARSSP
jgi:Tol biopolymer transport system component